MRKIEQIFVCFSESPKLIEMILFFTLIRKISTVNIQITSKKKPVRKKMNLRVTVVQGHPQFGDGAFGGDYFLSRHFFPNTHILHKKA